MDIPHINELRESAQVVGYGGVAALTWIFFDYVLTLADEIKFIWLKPWGPVKILFLWTRYLGLGLIASGVAINLTGAHSSKLCSVYLYLQGNLGVIILFTVEIILQLRIYAMYNKNKLLALFNGILFVGEIITIVTITNVGFSHSISHGTLPHAIGCYVALPRYLFSLWIPGLIYEFWLAALAVYKGIERTREDVTATGHRLDLITLLSRDSAVYYVLLAIALFTNVMIWVALPLSVAETAVPLAIACMVNGCTRLLLNLRSAVYKRDKTATLSQAEFASRQDAWSLDNTQLTHTLVASETNFASNAAFSSSSHCKVHDGMVADMSSP